MMRFFYRREKNSVKLNYRKHKISITILLLICLQQSQEILCQSVNRLRDLLSLDCCDEVLVSSSGPAEEYQSDRLGVYISVPGTKILLNLLEIEIKFCQIEGKFFSGNGKEK